MLKSLLTVAVLVVCSLAFTGAVSASAPTTQVRMEAKMRGPAPARIEAKVAYRMEVSNGRTMRKFQAEISRAAPGATFTVTHLGQVIGTITTNAFGAGKIERTWRSDLPNSPAVPVMAAGDAVAVGSFAGTLAIVR
ncbi:MAG: hypothetical protein JNJ48_02245 [Phycisphaerae bacterium]|nr:hypothetical protein [Phycisphaerae bacterium]